MARVRQKGTAPELRLRKYLWALGLRYRLHAKDLPGTPDIVFRGARVAVFVHGCFWHAHDCKQGLRKPKTNADYWLEKLRKMGPAVFCEKAGATKRARPARVAAARGILIKSRR